MSRTFRKLNIREAAFKAYFLSKAFEEGQITLKAYKVRMKLMYREIRIIYN